MEGEESIPGLLVYRDPSDLISMSEAAVILETNYTK